MSTMFYVALVIQAMFIVLALVDIKAVLMQILSELKKARRS